MKFNLIVLLFLISSTLSTWADETADKARPILDEVEKGYATLKSGDIPSANKLIRRANEAASILGKATTKDADWVKEAKRFQDLVKKITARAKGKPEPTTDTPDSGESAAPLDARDKHSLRTFNRDHDNYNRTLKSTPAASFKNEQVVANFRTRVGNLRKRYEVLRNKNHPSVKEAAGKVAEYEKAVNEKIKEAGFSEESPESPPVDKLSYRQRQAWDRVKSRHREIKSLFTTAQTKYDAWQKENEKRKVIPPSEYKPHLSSFEGIKKLFGNIDSDMKKQSIPVDHPTVKPTYDDLQAIRAKVDAWGKALQEGKAAADKVADPKSYPGLIESYEEMKKWIVMYKEANFSRIPYPLRKGANDFSKKKFQKDAKAREAAIKLLTGIPEVDKKLQTWFSKYSNFINANGGRGNGYYKQWVKTKKAWQAYRDRGKKYREEIVDAFDKDLKDLQKKVEWAKKNKSVRMDPIDHLFRQAQLKIDVLELFARNPTNVVHYPVEKLKSLQDRYAAETKEVQDALTALDESMTAENRAPNEIYVGSDIEALRGKMRAEWKRVYPDEEILAIRFHASGWKRTKKWVWTDTHHTEKEWSDRSVMSCIVIVKSDDRVATLYPAYFYKNHVSDSMSLGVQTRRGGYVIRKMLIRNLD